MERHEFLPRTAPSEESEGRDLPPKTQEIPDFTLAPRMEQIQQDGGGGCSGGCGCGGNGSGGSYPGNSHCNGNDHNARPNGYCEGYEGCGKHSWGLSGHPLAMVFASCQGFHSLYDTDEALKRGTLFNELDLPFEGADGSDCGCRCNAERRRV